MPPTQKTSSDFVNSGRLRTSTQETPSRRERRKVRTRRALLDVALSHFARRGIHGTRIEDITEQADLGKGAFYNYFDSKDDLVAALLTEAVEILDQDFLSRAIPSSQGAERVAALAAEHERFFETHSHYPVLFHQARGLLMLDPSPASRLRLVMRDYLARLARRLGSEAESTERAAAPSLDDAAAFAGAIHGYRSHARAAGLPIAPRTVITLVSSGAAGLLEKRSGA